jgi:putative ABC transport system permease protein
VLSGAGFGLLATLAFSRYVSNFLVGVSATDPITFVSATVFLVLIAIYACFVPARRAMNADPMIALRYE